MIIDNGNNSSVNKEGAENGIDGNSNNSSVNNEGAENGNDGNSDIIVQ